MQAWRTAVKTSLHAEPPAFERHEITPNRLAGKRRAIPASRPLTLLVFIKVVHLTRLWTRCCLKRRQTLLLISNIVLVLYKMQPNLDLFTVFPSPVILS